VALPGRVLQVLQGWWLVAWTAGLVGLAVAVTLAVLGTGPEGVGAWLRWTARVSGLLFYAAISASALRMLWRSSFTRVLLANRRYVGVSAAVAHTWHLAAIAVYLTLPDVQLEAGAALGGGLAYAFLLAMTVTSFDRTAAWLGSRRWKLLHTIGAWYVWFIFTMTFVGSAARSPFAALLGGLGVAVAMLRVVVALRRRRPRGAAGTAA
jgi:hypothetical protein